VVEMTKITTVWYSNCLYHRKSAWDSEKTDLKEKIFRTYDVDTVEIANQSRQPEPLADVADIFGNILGIARFGAKQHQGASFSSMAVRICHIDDWIGRPVETASSCDKPQVSAERAIATPL
jgi:hypothetical protein